MKKFKFVIVGGGTAGMMAAAYLKSYWADKVQITIVYDHKNPGIGVGESLTPPFIKFLQSINVSTSDLVKNVNATIKLGLKFKNWTGDGSYYYHPFMQIPGSDDPYNFTLASSIVNTKKDSLFLNEEYVLYDSYYFEQCKLPFFEGQILGDYSLHIDATLFSKFLEDRFRGSFIIKDEVVANIHKKENGHIDKLVCESGNIIEGDFFIDASGFQRVLFKHLGGTWKDMKDWLPLDRCIPNPVFGDFLKQPTCTTSEASGDGWILQVPLQNRWGSGYLYSSEFTTDEQAFERFSSFVKMSFKKDLNNTSKVLKFDSGYYEEQWIGNCLSVGLSCGFSEPLEATNIHQVTQQLGYFVQMFNFEVYQHDVNYYNKVNKMIFENIYLYLRFCYCNGRSDTEFWKYITNNEPSEVKEIKSKISKDIVNSYNLALSTPFNYGNFTIVANGLGLIDYDNYKNILQNRLVYDNCRLTNQNFLNFKSLIQNERSIDHQTLIHAIKATELPVLTN